MASRSELGRFSLTVFIYQKIINYTLYLQNKENDPVVMSPDLHSSGKNSFYSNVMRLSEFDNLPDFDPIFLTDAKIKPYVNLNCNKNI